MQRLCISLVAGIILDSPEVRVAAITADIRRRLERGEEYRAVGHGNSVGHHPLGTFSRSGAIQIDLPSRGVDRMDGSRLIGQRTSDRSTAGLVQEIARRGRSVVAGLNDSK